ncbi:UNVERIFIED_CONTAM: hypothetical protein FKN15_001174 [Acipenser sinensis]
MLDPGHFVEETVTMEEDPDLPASVVSVETSDDGTTRRTETTTSLSLIQCCVVLIDLSLSLSLSLSLIQCCVVLIYLSFCTLDSGYRAPSRQADPYAAQPQVRMGSNLELSRGGHPERFVPESYGLEDDQRSLGYEDLDYGLAPGGLGGARDYPSMTLRSAGGTLDPRRRLRSYEDTLDSDVGGGDPYYWSSNAPLAQAERGSMASLDGTLRKGGAPQNWRQPELPEVIAMLNYRLDPVKSNAAAFLQHLTFQNDKMKSDVRRLKGIPALVSLLDHPKKDVHYSACGALKNISFGREGENKVAIKNCDGVLALVRLLRKARDQDLTDCITESPQAWETALTNTAGCLSSERSEARRKLRECSGLVDALMYIVQSQINRQDVDNKVERGGWREEDEEGRGVEGGGWRGDRVEREEGKNNTEDYSTEVIDIPKRSVPAKGYELLFQPEVVRLYTSLLKESKIPAVLEAAAGALQNLCAGRWTYGRYIRAMVRQEKGLSSIAELLEHPQDRVVRGMSGALRNLAIDGRNRELIGDRETGADQQGRVRGERHGGRGTARGAGDRETGAGQQGRVRERHGEGGTERGAGDRETGADQQGRGREERETRRRGTERGAGDRETGADQQGRGREERETRRRGTERGAGDRETGADQQGRVRERHGEGGTERGAGDRETGADQQGRVREKERDTEEGGTEAQGIEKLVLIQQGRVRERDTEGGELREAQGIEKLVLINKDGNRTDREVRGAGLVLQTVWGYKELRKPLEKEGWKKTDFMVNLNPAPRNQGYEDSTLPLMDKRAGEKGDRDRDMIPMNDLGPEAYSTLDQRDRNRTLDRSIDMSEQDHMQV